MLLVNETCRLDSWVPFLSDTTDPCSVKESAKQVSLVLGKNGLNLLVNNAGVLFHSNMQTTGAKEMQDSFNTNVVGTMMVTKVTVKRGKLAVIFSAAETCDFKVKLKK